MKQSRGHYFVPSGGDIFEPTSFQLHSSIPLSVRRGNCRSTVAKKSRRKHQYFSMNRRKTCKMLRKEIRKARKSRSPTKSYILSDMYYNPDYKNSVASSVGFTEDLREAAHARRNNNL